MNWTGGIFKSLENVLEKVDSTAASTLGKKEKDGDNQAQTSSQIKSTSSASKPSVLQFTLSPSNCSIYCT